MNKKEALEIIEKELSVFRSKNYSELKDRIGSEPFVKELTSELGNFYQIEIQVFWDSEPNGNIRVIGSIDDGSLRAFVPLNSDFIMSPTGNFVGE